MARSTWGNEIVAELKRRGSYGQFFRYRVYRELNAVDSLESLHRFLLGQGITWTCVEFDAADVVDAIQRHRLESSQTLARRSIWCLLDPTGILGILDCIVHYKPWRSIVFRTDRRV